MSHPGLVVSEGSAVFSSVCAAGITGEHRLCCFDGCLRASRVAGGQAVDTLHISKRRSEEEMKIDVEKWQRNSLPIRCIYYHLHIRDTFVRACLYVCIYEWAGSKVPHTFLCVWFPLLLEPCDIIAFDLQINRESVHLLGGDGRCDGRAH